MTPKNSRMRDVKMVILNEDGEVLTGYTTEIGFVEEAEPFPAFSTLANAFDEVTLSIKMTRKAMDNLMDALCGLTKAVLVACPNRRVAHLALRASKKKVRNKNRRRAYRILEKEAKQ